MSSITATTTELSGAIAIVECSPSDEVDASPSINAVEGSSSLSVIADDEVDASSVIASGSVKTEKVSVNAAPSTEQILTFFSENLKEMLSKINTGKALAVPQKIATNDIIEILYGYNDYPHFVNHSGGIPFRTAKKEEFYVLNIKFLVSTIRKFFQNFLQEATYAVSFAQKAKKQRADFLEKGISSEEDFDQKILTKLFAYCEKISEIFNLGLPLLELKGAINECLHDSESIIGIPFALISQTFSNYFAGCDERTFRNLKPLNIDGHAFDATTIIREFKKILQSVSDAYTRPEKKGLLNLSSSEEKPLEVAPLEEKPLEVKPPVNFVVASPLEGDDTQSSPAVKTRSWADDDDETLQELSDTASCSSTPSARVPSTIAMDEDPTLAKAKDLVTKRNSLEKQYAKLETLIEPVKADIDVNSAHIQSLENLLVEAKAKKTNSLALLVKLSRSLKEIGTEIEKVKKESEKLYPSRSHSSMSAAVVSYSSVVAASPSVASASASLKKLLVKKNLWIVPSHSCERCKVARLLYEKYGDEFVPKETCHHKEKCCYRCCARIHPDQEERFALLCDPSSTTNPSGIPWADDAYEYHNLMSWEEYENRGGPLPKAK